MTSVDSAESLIYSEATDNDSEPPNAEDVEEFAKRIGIDLENEPELLYLAHEGLKATLPEHWRPCLDKTRDAWFYYNTETKKSQWEHPMNPVYRDKVTQARADRAMNRIQSFDPLTSRPPKSLPPLKKSGGGLAPINPAISGLGKLSGFSSAAGDLRQNSAPPNALNNNNPINPMNNNSGRASANIIASSSLKSFKDLDDDDSPPLVRPQKKLGLTLTGGGANFLKGSNSTSTTDGPSKSKGSDQFSLGNKDRGDGISDSESGAPALDKKPGKSILVNSNSRHIHKTPSDNVYEIDSFSINPDEMTDNEKMVYSQLESSSSRSKGNVKFNLDENAEFKFEMPEDEDDEEDEVQDKNDGDNDETDEEESSKTTNRNSQDHLRWIPNGSGDSNPDVQRRSALFSRERTNGDDVTAPLPIPMFSDTDIEAMKKAMRDEMEEELKKFKDQLEAERKTRQEQIEKHLEVTVSQFRSEREETLKRIKKDMDKEKTFEVDKAKREIDSLLQRELEEMKGTFETTLRQRQQEMETEYQKQIEELTAEYKEKNESGITEAIKKQASEESLKADVEFKKQKEGLREEHKRQLAQMRDYHKTIIERLKADLKADEEKLRQEHITKQAEMVSKFEQETDELRKRLVKKQEETLSKIDADFAVKRAELEKSLSISFQDVQEQINQSKNPLPEANAPGKTTDNELRHMKMKYQQLETKYRALKMELHQMAEGTPSKKTPIKIDKNNKKNELRPIRSGRLSPTLQRKSPEKNESFDVSDTNPDSAHGSESNSDSNSSLYASSGGGVPQLTKEEEKSEDPTEDLGVEVDESSSQATRINAALQALETLKQEILDLKSSSSNKTSKRQQSVETTNKKSPTKPIIVFSKSVSARKPSKNEMSPQKEPRSGRKKSSSGTTGSMSARSARKVSLSSPPTHDNEVVTSQPHLISRSVSVNPQDFSSGPHSDPASEDTHKRVVEEAKAFIRMQKNRLNDPSPIPDASHLIPKTKNNLLLFDEKLLKSASPRRPAAIHLDLVSETESSGVSSLKDYRSSESKKLTREIDEICYSLNNLDLQMKQMWAVVKGKHGDESLSLLNHTSHSPTTNYTALLPNTVPVLLGKSRVSLSVPPASIRKPVVPPTSPIYNNDDHSMLQPSKAKNYSSLLATNQTSSSQTVLDALRMSGMSASRLDCTELLRSLEDELREFKNTKQKLLDIQHTSPEKRISRNNNNTTSGILEKTKDLQEWIKKY